MSIGSLRAFFDENYVELLRLTATKRGRGVSGIYTMSATAENGQPEDPEEDCPAKCRKFLQAIYSIFASNFGLLLLLIAYTCAGAALFATLESPHEQSLKEKIKEERENIVRVLMNLTLEFDSLQVNQTNWTDVTRETLVKYESIIYEAYKDGMISHSTDNIWSFYGALFFCGTVYTSIGYGNIAPSTNWGRVACIIYAAIGIPLAMIVLADLGRRITRGLKFLWAFVRRYYYTGYCRRVNFPLKDSRSQSYDINTDPEENRAVANGTEVRPGVNMYYGYEVDDQFNLPITVAVLVIVIYLLFGAGMYTIWEEWNYLEAFYFVFISLSTIGFGDVLPAHPKFFLLSSVYIFIGLSLVSMVINVAIEFFSQTIDRAKEHIDRAKVMTLDKAKEKLDQAKGKVAEIKNKLESDSISSASENETGCNAHGKRKGSAQDTVNGSGKKQKDANKGLTRVAQLKKSPEQGNSWNSSTGSVSMLEDLTYVDS
ncbi:TWiK family of potassium channels protein 18-like isoform X2 [Liolophura sinensis]|uniref:TWiK family of potassium channels protein 18-like isoform X2 n=1 Tax=Liolophura sinensis TaxID=3198878 RepID=UPI0031598236